MYHSSSQIVGAGQIIRQGLILISQYFPDLEDNCKLTKLYNTVSKMHVFGKYWNDWDAQIT